MKKVDKSYAKILGLLKEKIRQARTKAAFTVNAQLLGIYWEIGKTILEQQKAEGWGAKVTSRLAKDLKQEFPDMKGLSERNLVYMQSFATAYPFFPFTQATLAKSSTAAKKAITQGPPAETEDAQFVQAPLAQLTWYHHQTLLDKVKDANERIFYIHKTIENGWSRDVMVLQIESNLFKRQGKAITNFAHTMPAADSDLARETFKSPYNFDFLMLTEEAKEKDLEKALIESLKKFMLELGKGFAYVGNQYNLNVAGDDFFLDLLFYNTHLHCYVIFELKIGEFKPEFAGKLNFYINTVNEQIKGAEDKPTIGVLLCKTPNETVVKFSLQNIDQPMGVAEYQLANALPKQLKGEMPSMKELEAELDKETERFRKPLDKKINRLKDLIRNLKEEEVKQKRSPENIKTVLCDVAIPIRNKIDTALNKEKIAPLFERIEIWIRLDGSGFDSAAAAIEHLEKVKFYNKIQIEINAKGFKKAGTKAFICYKDIYILLNEYNYSIGIGQPPEGQWLEKLYHQLPTEAEMNLVVDKLMEALVDDINKNLERISGESK